MLSWVLAAVFFASPSLAADDTIARVYAYINSQRSPGSRPTSYETFLKRVSGYSVSAYDGSHPLANDPDAPRTGRALEALRDLAGDNRPAGGVANLTLFLTPDGRLADVAQLE